MAPLPSTSSRAPNPFDSDDDDADQPAPAPYSNPFDDPPPPRSGTAARRSSRGRPESGQDQRPSGPHTQVVFDARNPFDDDVPSEKPRDRVLSQGTLYENDLKPPAESRNDRPEEEQGLRKSSRSHMRERVSAAGGAALKNAQKIKDAGASQASQLMEGGLNQAHRLKESSRNAFKANGSNDGNGELTRTKPKPQAREQLLASEGESHSRAVYGSATRTRYDDNQFQSADLEYKSVQELEGYALQKSEETTAQVRNCLKVAEDIKADATKTLLNLHEQGEQIRRTHEVALDIDQNLSAGEKLLGSLGGMFSKTWKPKKGGSLAGPVISRNDSFKRRGHHLEQRVALGLNSKGRNDRSSLDSDAQSHQQTTQAKLETEKTKQDDALSDLSNILDQLKEMSLDMGAEISSQNVSLEHFQDDIISLDERVKGANIRGRRLLGK